MLNRLIENQNSKRNQKEYERIYFRGVQSYYSIDFSTHSIKPRHILKKAKQVIEQGNWIMYSPFQATTLPENQTVFKTYKEFKQWYKQNIREFYNTPKRNRNHFGFYDGLPIVAYSNVWGYSVSQGDVNYAPPETIRQYLKERNYDTSAVLNQII